MSVIIPMVIPGFVSGINTKCPGKKSELLHKSYNFGIVVRGVYIINAANGKK